MHLPGDTGPSATSLAGPFCLSRLLRFCEQMYCRELLTWLWLSLSKFGLVLGRA